MFTSAMMFGMQVFTMDVNSVLNQTIFDVAVVALICCVSFLLILVFVFLQPGMLNTIPWCIVVAFPCIQGQKIKA